MKGNVGIDNCEDLLYIGRTMDNIHWTYLILMDTPDMLDKLHMLMDMTAVCTWQR